MSNPHPPPLVPSEARLSDAFIDALNLKQKDLRKFPDYCASRWVLDLIMGLVTSDEESNPAWCAAPGSPEGLAALAVIAGELGYAPFWHLNPPGTMFHIPNPSDSLCGRDVYFMEICVEGWSARCYSRVPWSDPTALPRLLHLLLGLAPGMGGAQ